VYATRKALYFPTLSGWAVFAACFIVAQSEVRVKRFFACLTLFAMFITVAAYGALRSSFASGNFRVLIRALGSHNGTLGVMVGTGVIMLLLYNLYYVKKPWLRLTLWGVILGIMAMLLFMGSRTSFAFPIIGSLLPLYLNIRWPRTPGRLLGLMASAVLVIVLLIGLWEKVVTLVPGGPTTLRRFQTLQERGVESEGRFRNLEYAQNIIQDSSIPVLLFGHGVGSWPLLIGEPDQQLYPHNISAELMIELGFVGLALFWIMGLISVRNLGPLRDIRNDPVRVFLLTAFLTQFVIAHVSGDLHENRGLFVMMGLMTFDWGRKTMNEER
jgi:hypothetical protein